MRRPHTDDDARQAGERLDAADDLRRPVLAFESNEPRREIANANLGAMSVGEDRLDDRGVAHIARLGLSKVGKRDLAEAFLFVVGEQAREHRIGIEIGEAPPHDSGVAVDERGGAGVADQRQVEVLVLGLQASLHARFLRSANSASQSRTARGSGKTPVAPGRRLPTE